VSDGARSEGGSLKASCKLRGARMTEFNGTAPVEWSPFQVLFRYVCKIALRDDAEAYSSNCNAGGPGREREREREREGRKREKMETWNLHEEATIPRVLTTTRD